MGKDCLDKHSFDKHDTLRNFLILLFLVMFIVSRIKGVFELKMVYYRRSIK